MYINNRFSEAEQRNIRIEIMRMKNRSPEEIFSEEYRKNNEEAFNYYFENNYKLILNEDIFTQTSGGINLYFYYNESKKDGRFSVIYDRMFPYVPSMKFDNVKKLKSSIEESDNEFFNPVYQKVLDKFEELAATEKKKEKKLK